MGKDTKIAWCDHTRNIYIGCTKATYVDERGRRVVHPACAHCYAEKLSRFRGWAKWGAKQVRRIKSASTWNQPLGWAREAAEAGEQRTVFLLSLGDILDEEMDRQPAMRDAFDREMDMVRATHSVCRRCGFGRFQRAFPRRKQFNCGSAGGHEFSGGLTYLMLTKRPQRWRLVPEDVRRMAWLGTSAADQPTYDRWVSALLMARGFMGLFVSVEPQVAPIDFGLRAALGRGLPVPDRIIMGGESGAGAREFHLNWARNGVAVCRSAGISVFVKQLGRVPVVSKISDGGGVLALRDPAGADMAEWPEDLRVQDPWPRLRAA